MELALIILAAVSISGSAYIVGTLLRDDAAEDVSDRIAYGDVVRLPAVQSPFHDGDR
jgi:hypothetical protein